MKEGYRYKAEHPTLKRPAYEHMKGGRKKNKKRTKEGQRGRSCQTSILLENISGILPPGRVVDEERSLREEGRAEKRTPYLTRS